MFSSKIYFVHFVGEMQKIILFKRYFSFAAHVWFRHNPAKYKTKNRSLIGNEEGLSTMKTDIRLCRPSLNRK